MGREGEGVREGEGIDGQKSQRSCRSCSNKLTVKAYICGLWGPYILAVVSFMSLRQLSPAMVLVSSRALRCASV